MVPPNNMNDPQARLLAAVLNELGDRPTKTLGEALGLDGSQGTRIANGGRALSIDDVIRYETFFDLPAGAILRAAGLIADVTDARTAIAADRALTPGQREVVLDAYDSAVRRSDKERSARTASKSPTTPKTRSH